MRLSEADGAPRSSAGLNKDLSLDLTLPHPMSHTFAAPPPPRQMSEQEVAVQPFYLLLDNSPKA